MVGGEHAPAGAPAVGVALLHHGPVGVVHAPAGQQRRVLPQRGHPVPVHLVERIGEVVLRIAGREVEPGGGRRVEAVDVVQLDRVEPLPRAHGDALAQHRLERVELAQVDPALLGEAEVDVPECADREIRARGRVGAVVLPGQVKVADRARVGQGARLPAGPDRGDLRPGGQEAVDVVDVHRVAPGALQRGGPADLPVPAHRMAGTVQVRRVPAVTLTQ